MGAVAGGQLHRLAGGRTSCGNGDAVEVAFDGALFGGGEKHLALFFVDPGNAIHFPIAVRELRELPACEVVKVEMAETRAFARPEESRAVGQKFKVVAE